MPCHKSLMLRALSPLQARIAAILLALACLWAALLSPAAPQPPTGLPFYSDIQLYHAIAARVSQGEDYYEAATTLQRAHNFPTQPFVTVREPTLSLLGASFGWERMRGLLGGLLLLATVLWYRQLQSARLPERIGAGLAILLGGGMVSQPALVVQHEQWAGVLLALALLFRGGRLWPVALLFAGAALAIRELALPFVLLALLFALVERRRHEVLGWTLLVVVFALGMAFHAHAVNAVAGAHDPVSQGWNGLRGPAAVLRDLIDVSLLNRLPGALARPLALLALFGWLAVPLRQARFAVLWFAGYALMLALFARSQNFYWAIMLLPAWFIGFAFLPRALSDLANAALAGRKAAL